MNTISQRGFSPLIIVGIIAVVLVGGYFVMRPGGSSDTGTPTPSVMMDKKEGDTMMNKEDSGAMMPKESGVMTSPAMSDGVAGHDDMMMKFSGTVLAGTTSPLLDFNKSDYDTAIASGKLAVLFFYANWCPICKAEFPKMQEVFNGLTGDDVIGFRVNYNDNETDVAEKDLARQFGVAYQHTKVFVKNDTRLVKAPETWLVDMYLSEINTYK